MPLYVIAGHGAGDSGACGCGYQEAERVRALATRTGELGGGDVVVLDMSRNWFADRGILGLDLAPGSQIVELHMDSGPRGARGGHVIVKPGKQPDGYDLALAALLSGMFPGRAESIRGQSLANATRAAQKGYGYRLLECGFITNELDVNTFNTHIDRFATGILAAFGIVPGASNEEEDLKPVSNDGGDVYRLYNPNSGFHHYTLSTVERDSLVAAGWRDEKVAWRAPRGGTVAIYRLYDPSSGDHFYTADFDEACKAQDGGYVYEGVPFSGADDGTAVMRLYNPNSGEHFYTTDAAERDDLVGAGWNDEGVSWYAAG